MDLKGLLDGSLHLRGKIGAIVSLVNTIGCSMIACPNLPIGALDSLLAYFFFEEGI
jgi:hypothetical protein